MLNHNLTRTPMLMFEMCIIALKLQYEHNMCRTKYRTKNFSIYCSSTYKVTKHKSSPLDLCAIVFVSINHVKPFKSFQINIWRILDAHQKRQVLCTTFFKNIINLKHRINIYLIILDKLLIYYTEYIIQICSLRVIVYFYKQYFG